MHKPPDQMNKGHLRGTKRATPDKPPHRHNQNEKIPGKTATSISRQHSPGNIQPDPGRKSQLRSRPCRKTWTGL